MVAQLYERVYVEFAFRRAEECVFFVLFLLVTPLLIFVDSFFFVVFFFSADLTACLPNTFMILVTEMLLAILSICSQEELVDSDAESDEAEAAGTTEDLAARRQLIKSKILAVGRMQKVFQLLRFVFFSSLIFSFFFFLFFFWCPSPMALRHSLGLLLNHLSPFPLFCCGDEKYH